MDRKLTIKQEKFCQVYVLTGNASEAYRKAYNCIKMKPDSIHQKASFLLKQVHLRSRLDILLKDTYERNKATIDEVISIASDMLRADISEVFDENGNMIDVKKIPKSVRMAISGIETDEIKVDGLNIGKVRKVKMSDRTKIIDLFMKHYGEFAKDNEQKKSNITIFKLPDNGR